jgi:hypothetical protein
LSVFAQEKRMLKQCRLVKTGETLLAVDADEVEVGRSAEDALLLPPHAGQNALAVVDVPAFELQGGVAVQTNTTNICKVQLLLDVLLPSQLHSAHLLLEGFFGNVEVGFLPWSLIRFWRVLIIVSKTLAAEAGTDMGKKAGEGFNHRVAHRTKGLAAAEL